MADRFQHEDSLKAQDVTLRGKRLIRRRKGRMGHEASRHAERGEMDRDKRGIVAKKTEKLSEAAGEETKAAGRGASTYIGRKRNKAYKDLLEEAGDI